MNTVTAKSTDLVELLMKADADDISVLVDYLTDNGNGRLSLSSSSLAALCEAKGRARAGRYARNDIELIVSEIERFGGNSFFNFFRGGEGVPYEEIVRDVRDHVGAKNEPGESVATMERQILSKVLERAWERMSPEQRAEIRSAVGLTGVGALSMAAVIAAMKMGGFGTYKVALLIANTLAKQLTGTGLKLATNAGIAKALGVVAGPVGWIATGLWTAFDLASPAYRVTLPCVVQIAYIRQRLLSAVCVQCYAPNAPEATSCVECGAPLAKRS